MQIKGIITHVGEVVSGQGSKGPWNKFQAVITEQGPQYPKSLVFDVFNDKVAVSLNEECTIHFETKANEYNGKWYNNVNAFKKEGGSASAPASSAPSAAPAPTSAPAPAAPAPAPAPTGGKLAMNDATYEAAAKKIAAEGDQAKQTEMLNNLKEKYAMTDEQIATLDGMILPF